MKTRNFTLILVFSLFLTACGGGSSINNDGTADTDTGMTGGEPKVLHSLAGNGLFTAGGTSFSDDTSNPSSGSFADSSTNNTEYSPLTAAISRDFDENTSAIATDFFVTSISKSSAGLEINYKIGDEAMSVTMTRADCFPDPAPWINCDKEGAYLWSMTSTDPTEFDQNDEFQHMEVQHLLAHGYRTNYLFGVNPQTLPGGSAKYAGRFRADAYKMTSASTDQRVRYQGAFLLSANFDMSELSGRIHNIRGSQPGQSSGSDRVSWPTSYFTITDGRIVNGQFTAVLTAGDNDPNTPFNESMRGYMGHILGEFFGPNAEEVGAVVSASRDVAGEDHDYVMYGLVGGTRFVPAPVELGSAAMTSGILRNRTTDTTELLEDDGMAKVERITDGWRIHVDGRTVELRDSDYASLWNGYYARQVEGGVAWLWSETDWQFTGMPEFDHFDVKGWSFEEKENPEDDWVTEADRYLVHGNRTAESAMPTSGSAVYEGRLRAWEMPSNKALESISSSGTFIDGDVSLNADFAASTLTGTFSDLETRTGSRGTRTSAAGGATFNATVSAGGFTASDLSGSGAMAGYSGGNVSGAFFGPAAEEVAGVFDATDSSANRVMNGWFGASKEQ